jgi:hypothetical protein
MVRIRRRSGVPPEVIGSKEVSTRVELEQVFPEWVVIRERAENH